MRWLRGRPRRSENTRYFRTRDGPGVGPLLRSLGHRLPTHKPEESVCAHWTERDYPTCCRHLGLSRNEEAATYGGDVRPAVSCGTPGEQPTHPPQACRTSLAELWTSGPTLHAGSGSQTTAWQPCEPLDAIFPGHMAPIIKQSADGERELRHAQLGLHPAARRLCAQACDQHARRQGHHQVLEGQLREAPLPGASHCVLRAGRRQASSMALVHAEQAANARCSPSPASIGSGRDRSRRTDRTWTSRCSRS